MTKFRVPADPIREIERVQPYNAGYEILNDLNTIVNEDKHRTLLLCYLEIASEMELGIDQGDKRWSTKGNISSRRGEKLQTTRKGPAAKAPIIVNMKSSSTLSITFKNPDVPRRPVDQLLPNILKCVSDIIPRFDRFFP
jgi:hypothetical protein